MSFIDHVTESQLVLETTMHGISQLRFTRSKYRFAFWLSITLVAMVYAGYEISKEIRHISFDLKFELTHRLASLEEIVLPSMGYCFSNPLDIFDWTVVHNSMIEFNWTEEDVGHLLSIYEYFEKLDFASRNASMEYTKKLGNITQAVFKPMLRRMCKNSNGTGYQQPRVWDTKLDPPLICLLIDCQQPRLQQEKQCHLVRVKNNTRSKQTAGLRMKTINFMQTFHGVNMHTGHQDYLFSRNSYPAVILLEENAYNAYMIYPEMSNSPTLLTLLCWNNSHATDNLRIPRIRPAEDYSSKPGVDCFKWTYNIKQISDGKIERTKLHGEQTTMSELYYPSYNEWRVQEYKPKSVWYQLLSNIGGTLSMWTGASILSFLHLIEVLIYSCCKRSFKVDSQHVQPTA